jgi:hypothetical protein
MIHKNTQDSNANINKTTASDELHTEARTNKSTEDMHEQAAEEQWKQSQSQSQSGTDYVDGGFSQQSFQDAFKTNDGNSAEQVIGSLGDAFFKPISTGALNERATRIIEVFKDHYKQAQEAQPSTMRVDFIQSPGPKISHFYGGFTVAIPVTSADGTPQVSAHLVIVESRIKLQPRVETQHGTSFTFHNTAGNTVTDDTMAGVEKLVRTHYRN